jgi:hypothetical protein
MAYFTFTVPSNQNSAIELHLNQSTLEHPLERSRPCEKVCSV